MNIAYDSLSLLMKRANISRNNKLIKLNKNKTEPNITMEIIVKSKAINLKKYRINNSKKAKIILIEHTELIKVGGLLQDNF